MDPREYLDARWYALLRAADELGVPEEEAPALVQRVLAANQRRIRRAEDPDPLVHAALEEAVRGPAPRSAPRWPWVAAAAAGALVAGVVVGLTRDGGLPVDHLRGDQVPSVFGYDATSAERYLESRGLRVTGLPIRSCDVMGRVVGTDPPTGTPFRRGDRVTVYSAVPADVACLTDYQDQAAAWRLLDFANGRGTAPEFADRIFVYGADGERVVLSGADVTDPDAWRRTGVLDALREASSRVALVSERPVEYAVPGFRVVPVTADRGGCGVPRAAMADDSSAFSLEVRPPTRAGCPVRVDVFRADPRADAPIEAVALYPSR